MGTDWGLGKTNIDTETGIRYGVLNQQHVLEAWADSSEPFYGDPFCPKCNGEVWSTDDSDVSEDCQNIRDYYCPECKQSFDAEACFSDPQEWGYYDDGYNCRCDEEGDIFIMKSPYYTRAEWCSPCAPGAIYLMSPKEDGEKGYCFDSSWFEDGKVPYNVYSIETGQLVTPKSV